MPGGVSKFSLTVSPAKLPEGKTATVWDTGQTKLHIVTQAVEINRVNGVCHVTGLAPYAEVRPASITLSPGHHRTAHVDLGNVPAGKHDLGITFENLGTGHGTVRVNGAVAAQMLVTGRGHVAHPVKPCVSLSQPNGGSFPTALVAGSVLAVILLAIGIIITIKHRRAIRNVQ